MKIIALSFLLVLSAARSLSQDNSQHIITQDVTNFWQAYDKIITTKDSLQQLQYLNSLFLEKGTPGLKAIMIARNYTAESYINAINNYPQFWTSIRKNVFNATQFAKDIELDINKIKNLYPELRPAKIYFTIGALRTGGTTLDGMVLIGSEIAMADQHTVTSEFPNEMGHLDPYFKTNPIHSVAFNNTHEYIHTQQTTTIGNTLLAQCIIEGVAEFITVLGTGKSSTTPAIPYGTQNENRVREIFSKQLFNVFTGFWLYSNAENEFKVRDMGYYTGYAICEKYYNKATNKKKAIKEMIELDYNDETALIRFVDQSGYFSKPLKKIKKQFEQTRPYVTGITGFKNGDINVSPSITQLTIHFSKPMDESFRNFELGPLGEKNVLRLTNFVGFSADKKSATFDIKLAPDQQYQIIINSGFRSDETYALSLKPYLIDIKTGGK